MPDETGNKEGENTPKHKDFAPDADGLLSGSTSQEDLERRRKEEEKKRKRPTEVQFKDQMINQTAPKTAGGRDKTVKAPMPPQHTAQFEKPQVIPNSDLKDDSDDDSYRPDTTVLPQEPRFVPSVADVVAPIADGFDDSHVGAVEATPSDFDESFGSDWDPDEMFGDADPRANAAGTLIMDIGDVPKPPTTQAPTMAAPGPIDFSDDFTKTDLNHDMSGDAIAPAPTADLTESEMEFTAPTADALDSKERAQLDSDLRRQQADAVIAADGDSTSNYSLEGTLRKAAEDEKKEPGTTTSSVEITPVGLVPNPESEAELKAMLSDDATDTEVGGLATPVDPVTLPPAEASAHVNKVATERLKQMDDEDNGLAYRFSADVPDDAFITQTDDAVLGKRLEPLTAEITGVHDAGTTGYPSTVGEAAEDPDYGMEHDSALHTAPGTKKIKEDARADPAKAAANLKEMQEYKLGGVIEKKRDGTKARKAIGQYRDPSKTGTYTSISLTRQKLMERKADAEKDRTIRIANKVRDEAKQKLQNKGYWRSTMRNTILGLLLGGAATAGYVTGTFEKLYNKFTKTEEPTPIASTNTGLENIAANAPDNVPSNAPASNIPSVVNRGNSNNANNAASNNAASNQPTISPEESEKIIVDYIKKNAHKEINLNDIISGADGLAYVNSNDSVERLTFAESAREVKRGDVIKINDKEYSIKDSLFDMVEDGITNSESESVLQELFKKGEGFRLIVNSYPEKRIEHIIKDSSNNLHQFYYSMFFGADPVSYNIKINDKNQLVAVVNFRPHASVRYKHNQVTLLESEPLESKAVLFPKSFNEEFIKILKLKQETTQPTVDVNKKLEDYLKTLSEHAILKDSKGNKIEFSDKGEFKPATKIKIGEKEYEIPKHLEDGIDFRDKDIKLETIVEYINNLTLEFKNLVVNESNEFAFKPKYVVNVPKVSLTLGRVSEDDETIYAELRYRGRIHALNKDTSNLKMNRSLDLKLGEIDLKTLPELRELVEDYFNVEPTSPDKLNEKLKLIDEQKDKEWFRKGIRPEIYDITLGKNKIQTYAKVTDEKQVKNLLPEKGDKPKTDFVLFGTSHVFSDFVADGISKEDLEKDPSLYKVIEEINSLKLKLSKPKIYLNRDKLGHQVTVYKADDKSQEIPVNVEVTDKQLELGMFEKRLVGRYAYNGKASIKLDKQRVEYEVGDKTPWFYVDDNPEVRSLAVELGAYLRNLEYDEKLECAIPNPGVKKDMAGLEAHIHGFRGREIVKLENKQFRELMEKSLSEDLGIKYGQFVKDDDAMFGALFTKDDGHEYIGYVRKIEGDGKDQYFSIVHRLPIRAVDIQFYKIRKEMLEKVNEKND